MHQSVLHWYLVIFAKKIKQKNLPCIRASQRVRLDQVTRQVDLKNSGWVIKFMTWLQVRSQFDLTRCRALITNDEEENNKEDSEEEDNEKDNEETEQEDE